MQELDAFLLAAKARGATDEFLVALMKEQGWPTSEVYQALGRHYAEATGVAIPGARGRMESAREAFFRESLSGLEAETILAAHAARPPEPAE